jgi:hypothetical protein
LFIPSLSCLPFIPVFLYFYENLVPPSVFLVVGTVDIAVLPPVTQPLAATVGRCTATLVTCLWVEPLWESLNVDILLLRETSLLSFVEQEPGEPNSIYLLHAILFPYAKTLPVQKIETSQKLFFVAAFYYRSWVIWIMPERK